MAIVLGIDPGLATIGYGFLETDGNNNRTIDAGVITTSPKIDFGQRLQTIYQDLGLIIKKHQPTMIAVERLFFNRNITNGIDVAGGRGLVFLLAAENDIPIYEYGPLQIKLALTGWGKAPKTQVQQRVMATLNLKGDSKSDDCADALAVALVCIRDRDRVLG